MNQSRQALSKLQHENKFASSTACEKAYVSSEEELDGLVKMRLPSVSKFDARLRIANESVERACKGPSRGNYVERMHKVGGGTEGCGRGKLVLL